MRDNVIYGLLGIWVMMTGVIVGPILIEEIISSRGEGAQHIGPFVYYCLTIMLGLALVACGWGTLVADLLLRAIRWRPHDKS